MNKQTEEMNCNGDIAPKNYYEHIANHPRTSKGYRLRDYEAMGFLLAMGKIELEGAAYSSGSELLDYLLDKCHSGEPQIVLAHKAVVVFAAIARKRPLVVVCTGAERLKEVLRYMPEVNGATLKALNRLIEKRFEGSFDVAGGDQFENGASSQPYFIPLSDCHLKLAKLGYCGILRTRDRKLPLDKSWKGRVRSIVTPVKSKRKDRYHDFADPLLWGDKRYYIPRHFLEVPPYGNCMPPDLTIEAFKAQAAEVIRRHFIPTFSSDGGMSTFNHQDERRERAYRELLKMIRRLPVSAKERKELKIYAYLETLCSMFRTF